MYGGFGSSPLEVLACSAMVSGLVYLDEFRYACKWEAGTNTALTRNGDKTVNIQINSDSDFIAQAYFLTVQSFPDDRFGALPNFWITMTRSGSGRDLMNQSILVPNYCGNFCGWVGSPTDDQLGFSNDPGRNSITSLFQGNSTVGIRLQNPMSNWDPNVVQFVMCGFKVFYQTNSQGKTGNRQEIFHAL